MIEDIEDTEPRTSRAVAVLRKGDFLAFGALMIFLAVVVLSSGRANIQTDAIDYYAIVQRIVASGGNPIARNLHFVEQRSPGYPLLALLPYHVTSWLIEPLVETQEIAAPANRAPGVPGQRPTETLLIPGEPLLLKDVFFKDIYVETQDSWFRWKIIASMLFASYALLFAGMALIAGTLALERKPVVGASLGPLVVLTSGVFMHNIVNTPAYATLAAFGISCLFTYFFVKGCLFPMPVPQFTAGLAMGLLVLTRLETIVIAVVVLVSLAVIREFDFLKKYLLGGLLVMTILLVYNLSQFGNPLHLGILQGDVNLITLDLDYVYANVFHPQSGILFWSPLIVLGIAGLFVDPRRHSRILGFSSLALIAVILLRVPVMVRCVGEGTVVVGGLPIRCPADTADVLMLIRSDANRYLSVLIPFSVLGLRALLGTLSGLWPRMRGRGEWAKGGMGK